MGVIEVIGGVILLVAAVIVIVSAMLQEGKQGALNALAGSNESSYLGKNKNRSFQATLVRVTKYFGIVFMVVTLAVYFISLSVMAIGRGGLQAAKGRAPRRKWPCLQGAACCRCAGACFCSGSKAIKGNGQTNARLTVPFPSASFVLGGRNKARR